MSLKNKFLVPAHTLLIIEHMHSLPKLVSLTTYVHLVIVLLV